MPPKLQQRIESLVRDLTKVHPMPKSEVRAAILELTEETKSEEFTRISRELYHHNGHIAYVVNDCSDNTHPDCPKCNN